jgi:AcrR family transcriptional regulator
MGGAAGGGGGLREHKKRVMRQRLSDVATGMFLERGFDAVRVAEVAEACGVSEKTVFNYFPVKEALVMDRLEDTLAALRAGLEDRAVGPVEAVVAVLGRTLGGMTGWEPGSGPAGGAEARGEDAGGAEARGEDAGGAEARGEDAGGASSGRAGGGVEYAARRAGIRRFGELIRVTPALWAYQAEMMERSVAAAAGILAARAGLEADDPEAQIAARALMGLWRVQADSLRQHLDDAETPGRLHELVMADVGRAARVVASGVMGPEMHYDS